MVAGKSYNLLSSNTGYSEIGLASWYGNKFHGNFTANGEVFDMYGLSAAHRHLILPAIVKITNLENGRSSILRVNDRGPFYDDRLIDVSVAAAVQLGFYEKGLAKVHVEVLDIEAGTLSYTIEVGQFADNESALALLVELRTKIDFESEKIRVKPISSSSYSIEIGPIDKKRNLEKIEALIKVMDLTSVRVLLKD
jgi:rare lipoprotein A